MQIHPELTATIARHMRSKGTAEAILAALETVIGHAESQLEDLESGVEQGLYEEGENRADIEELRNAIALLQGDAEGE